MQAVNKLMMISILVNDMPRATEFYVDKLGLKKTIDYRQADDNWYVTLKLPEGGAVITLSTFRQNRTPGTVSLYFETSDIAATHQELSNKGIEVGEVGDDLFGPGSGVKFINLTDPDGNQVLLAQAHKAKAPF